MTEASYGMAQLNDTVKNARRLPRPITPWYGSHSKNYFFWFTKNCTHAIVTGIALWLIEISHTGRALSLCVSQPRADWMAVIRTRELVAWQLRCAPLVCVAMAMAVRLGNWDGTSSPGSASCRSRLQQLARTGRLHTDTGRNRKMITENRGKITEQMENSTWTWLAVNRPYLEKLSMQAQ